ncbi:RNA-binding protein 43 [Pyxicephalus adspersus]|uniref:RNA-binding protein 43 n=1 Tax=Pyxicephalus adspersus TaxID=30357 RepID=UPI003B5C6EA9
MADNYVLRVSGVPASHCKDDVLHDKLLIHFLQRKNGGDGQVHVQYPTKERGVAMLTFDRAEVADQVLAMSHELQIEMSAFPLKVTRSQRETKVSMPIKTSLNLNHFDDFSEVHRLLCKHDLKIYAETPSSLFIEGDFLNLSQCRDDLYKIMNSSLLSEQYKENTTSSVDKDFTTEYGLDDHHRVSREVSVQKSSGKQSPAKGSPDMYKNPDRNPSPRPRRRSESSLVENDGNISTGDNNRSPYIKPYLGHHAQTIHNFSSYCQWKAKDSSLYNSFSITKHTRSKIAANLNISPAPTKRILSDEERGSGENSPLTSGGNSSDSSGLGSHTFTSTQFGDDMADFRQANRTFAADSSTNQSKYKGINEDEATYNPMSTMKNPTSLNPGEPKNPSADDFTDNPKTTMKYLTSLNPGQPINPSADDITYNPKTTIKYPTSLNPGQPKKLSADDITYNSKTTMKNPTSKDPGQPKNISADDITYNPKSTMKYPTSMNPGMYSSLRKIRSKLSLMRLMWK